MTAQNGYPSTCLGMNKHEISLGNTYLPNPQTHLQDLLRPGLDLLNHAHLSHGCFNLLRINLSGSIRHLLQGAVLFFGFHDTTDVIVEVAPEAMEKNDLKFS